jgi:hypothetical protein
MGTSRSDPRRTPATAYIRVVATVVGVFLAVGGVWAMVAPESFFDTAATFEPYNQHFLQDIGAFQIGLGAVLLLAVWVSADALTVALLGVGVGGLAHAVSHARRDPGRRHPLLLDHRRADAHRGLPAME